MADSALTTASGSRWARMPVAVRIGILYLLARVVTTGLLALAAQLSGPASRFGADASVGDLAVAWDGQWYWFTALNGYPVDLPLTASGQVAENPWAFMPLFSFLALTLGGAVGSWIVGAVIISLVAGYLSCLVLYRMLRLRLDGAASLWAVAFFAAGPLAAMFQVAYAESLFLLWLLLSLWLVMRRRYRWLYLLVPLMAFTRPGVLAFALFLGLFGLWRWASRRADPLPVREAVHIAALAVWAAGCGFAWQVIAAVATGDPQAYLATELAWRRNWIPGATGGFVPFDGFGQGIAFWFTSWGFGEAIGYMTLAASVVLIAAVLLFEPHVKLLGVPLRLWTASYLFYLLAVFFPQSSIFRLLLPVSPLWGALAAPRSTVWRAGVLIAAIAGQWWWIYNMYALANTYWQIP